MSKSLEFNDPIHGVIQVSPLEQHIIDHAYFQRLRRVKALGFLDRVFPSAKHSRFEHSIGACHVAGLIMKSLQKNIEDHQPSNEVKWSVSSSFKILNTSDSQSLLSVDAIKRVRIAALLHDIGHGPFSHASEGIMLQKTDLIESNKVSKEMEDYLKNKAKKENKPEADHEDYSILLIDAILKDIHEKHKDLLSVEDIQWILSIKSGSSKFLNAETHDEAIGLFHSIVDGEFDSDRMDYLLRDSHFCGVPYGNYDIDRLISGLLVLKSKKDKLTLSLRRPSLSAFEDFLFARYQMHAQVYSHRVDVACNSGFTTLAKKGKYKPLPSSISEYVKWDDESFLFLFEGDGKGELEDLIRDRKLWKTVYESFSQDQSDSSVIVQKIGGTVDSHSFKMKDTDKPFRKENLLKLPIVTKDMLGDLLPQEAKATSALISHYNSSYFALRVSVSPTSYMTAKRILSGAQPEATKETDLDDIGNALADNQNKNQIIKDAMKEKAASKLSSKKK